MTLRSTPFWVRVLIAASALAWAVAVTVSAGGRQASAAKAQVAGPSTPITVSNKAPQAAPPGAWTASDCATCHDKTVNANFQHSAHGRNDQSCATCHKNVSEHFAAKAAGEANAPSPSLKVLPVKQVNDTCLTCHEKGARANWHGGHTPDFRHQSAVTWPENCPSLS